MSRPGVNAWPVVNLRLVAKTAGTLILVLSAAMVLPMTASFWAGSSDWFAFVLSILLLGIPGFFLSRMKSGGPMRPREALLTVSLGWIVCAAASTLPFLLTGALPNFVDAFFETMSGLTTTGATVLPDIESHPAGVLYWRSLLHWLGGLGIIVIFLAVLPQVGGSGTQLFQAEVPGVQKQRLRPKLRESAKILLWIYIAMTVLEIAALVLAGMSPFDAQIHTFGTMGTGGFSNKAASVGAYNSPVIEAIIIVFMIAAGTNFALYYRTFFAGDRSAFRTDPEFRGYLGFLGTGIVVVALALANRYGLVGALRHAVFQVVSIMTTTGFATADFDTWPEIARLVLLLLMFVGACAGSTGGAIKVTRLIIFGKHMYRELLRVIHPDAVMSVSQGHDVIPEKTVRQVSAFIGLYVSSFILATLCMAGLGLDLTSASSSVAATLGNIGPGLGVVGPTLDYSVFPQSGKALLTLMMLLGRLEIFTVLAVLTPAFWRR